VSAALLNGSKWWTGRLVLRDELARARHTIDALNRLVENQNDTIDALRNQLARATGGDES
jgi:hypothetical protein